VAALSSPPTPLLRLSYFLRFYFLALDFDFANFSYWDSAVEGNILLDNTIHYTTLIALS